MTRFFALISSLCLFAPAARAADWKPVAPADGSFSAEMPVEPKLLDRSVDGPKGPIRQVVHFCKVDGALYSIQAIEAPARGSLDARKAAASAERAAYLKSDKGKLVREEAVTIGGQPGWDFTLKGPPPTGGKGTVTSRVRMLVAERAVYTVTVMSALDKPLPEEAGRFFDSFRLGGKGKAEVAKGREGAGPDPKAGKPPEEVLRAFFLAMILNDEAQVRALALPADGLELLWKGVPPPPEAEEQVKKQIAGQAIKTLKPGDEFTLPGKRRMTVPDEDVADDRAVMLPEGAPTPTRMRKVDGQWRVDARPLIAARKAAAAAKAKAKAKDKDKAGN
jgi:hypothetical protein